MKEEISKENFKGVPVLVQQVKNPAGIHKDVGSLPGPAQWVKDLALLWLWCRLAAVALIESLAWELPYATGVVPKKQKKKKKNLKMRHYNNATTVLELSPAQMKKQSYD